MAAAMFRVKVFPDGGGEPYVLIAEARDVLLWEKAGRDRAFNDLTDRLKMTDVYSLMHVAAKRQGRFDGPLEVFEGDHALELLKPNDDDEDDGEEPGPTGRDR